MKSAVSGAAQFQSDLQAYRDTINRDIAEYARQLKKTTRQNFGPYSRVATDAYLSLLEGGGKRIRGTLAMVGYEMCGGTDQAMITQVARALEMIHAYVLIIDDICDRSLTRHGRATAHMQLAEYYKEKRYGDDAGHFGEAIAMNAALIASHAAQMVLANLNNIDEQLKLNALSILNRGLTITGHGQINDIFNEIAGTVDESAVGRVMDWKTAHYTFLNPLHVGMILAGADCHATDAITPYAMHAGRAFQITDDILGTFGEEFESGKSAMDDIREGKRTLLVVYALKHATTVDKKFLLRQLGNDKMTNADFERCKGILIGIGALKYAKAQAAHHVTLALKALKSSHQAWSEEGVKFLSGLAHFLQKRHT